MRGRRARHQPYHYSHRSASLTVLTTCRLLRDIAAADSAAHRPRFAVWCVLECCSGIADGARTGLHSVVVAVLFIVFLPFVPVLHAVPALVTAPCLILVGMYMVSSTAHITVPLLDQPCQLLMVFAGWVCLWCVEMAVSKFIDWERIDEALPAFLTSTLIAFTYSIGNGVISGLLAFAILKTAALVSGQFKRPATPLPLSPDAHSHPPPLSLGSPARRHSTSMLSPHTQPHTTHAATGLTSKDDPMPGSPIAYYVTPQSHAKRGSLKEGSSRRLLSHPAESTGYGATEQPARF